MPRAESVLETRLVEMTMRDLFPCDLGDGIEVVHDVEMIEIEMDCDVDDDADHSAPYECIEIQHEAHPVAVAVQEVATAALGPSASAFVRSAVWDTLPFALYEPIELDSNVPVAEEVAKGSGPVAHVSESARTTPFVRAEVETVPYATYSAPYERIEVVRSRMELGIQHCKDDR